MPDEKRTHERVSVNFPARWRGVSGGHEGRVEDVSMSGCFVNTTGAADVGEIISLLIQTPAGNWLPMRGKVIFYHQLTGFSISFSILNEVELKALRQLVAGDT
jgi:hypothetical protein